MTITSEQSKVIYQGNGSTREFTIPFSYANDADLEVLLQNAGGGPQVLTLGSDYSLSASSETSGGSCVLSVAPGAGSILAIRRDPPLLQETVYEEGVPLSAKSRENALDMLTMIAQSNRERIDRALLLPVSRAGEAPMVPAPVSGAVLAWDTEGNLCNGPDVGHIQSASTSASAAISAAATATESRDAAQAAQAAAEAARDEAEEIAGGEHNSLFDRDAENCHPQSSITGLEAALADKAGTNHIHALEEITGAGTAAGYTVGTDPDQIPTNADISTGGNFVREYITSSGDWTVPDGVTELWVWVMGGGGGGSSGRTSGGLGGGGGGCAYQHLTGLTPGAAITCTVGAGGAGATSYSGTGGTGGTSSFGSYCSATGGTGGKWATYAGFGGSAAGGNINYTGGDGHSPQVQPYSGGGGCAGGPFGGGGGKGKSGLTAVGNPGDVFGGGGGGGNNNAAADYAGGAGGSGGIVIEYYS